MSTATSSVRAAKIDGDGQPVKRARSPLADPMAGNGLANDNPRSTGEAISLWFEHCITFHKCTSKWT